ncbi:MAG: FHA domain-containing protein [Scytolyngbya sp. HA4215-MV1]|jgi:hypothetical protein|nr:FHA domain-containing protein [Scytolyngbya sp. HA4215-MV1]
MLHLKTASNSDPRTLEFLKQNPSLRESLFADRQPDLDRIETFIGSGLDLDLEAPKLGGLTPYYIQAVTAGRTTFLTTNLHNVDEVQVTEIATSWLIGRSPNCAICISNPLISRCHAVIGRSETGGFYITDVGSSNSTFVNRRKLSPLERRPLKDGDLIGFSSIQVEVFMVGCSEQVDSLENSTHS